MQRRLTSIMVLTNLCIASVHPGQQEGVSRGTGDARSKRFYALQMRALLHFGCSSMLSKRSKATVFPGNVQGKAWQSRASALAAFSLRCQAAKWSARTASRTTPLDCPSTMQSRTDLAPCLDSESLEAPALVCEAAKHATICNASFCDSV